jgi:uncharacterized damage-inducible protein DinB
VAGVSDETTPQRWTQSADQPDMWVDPEQDPRDSGVPLTDERGTLLEYLRAYRITFEMKCADLDAEQLARRSVPPSTMSLLGLLRHLANVERNWFRRVMAGEDVGNRWASADGQAVWEVSPDAEQVSEAWAAWREEVSFAESYVDAAPDLEVSGTMRDGNSLQLREVLVHVIEEYARHCGHADLLRECVDGRVGQ